MVVAVIVSGELGVMSGQVLMRCSTIEGSRPGISVYDHAKISLYSWKRALYEAI
jgi:hypothetical protein